MKIVVIGGSGLIGSKVVTCLREAGHEAVAASPDSGVNTLTGEGVPEVLAGASVVVDPTAESLRERVLALTRGRGADVVCEAVGKPALVSESLTLVRPGGVVQLVGVNPKGSTLPLDLYDVHFREIRIHGAFGRGGAYRRALALMPKLKVKPLVTARFSLDRIEDAFAHATAGRGVKTMIVPGG